MTIWVEFVPISNYGIVDVTSYMREKNYSYDTVSCVLWQHDISKHSTDSMQQPLGILHKAVPFIIHVLVVFMSTAPPRLHLSTTNGSVLLIPLISTGGIFPRLPSQQHRRRPHGSIATTTTLLYVSWLLWNCPIPPVLIFYLARPRCHRPWFSVPSAML